MLVVLIGDTSNPHEFRILEPQPTRISWFGSSFYAQVGLCISKLQSTHFFFPFSGPVGVQTSVGFWCRNIIGSLTNIPYLPNGLKKSLFFLWGIYIQQPIQTFVHQVVL